MSLNVMDEYSRMTIRQLNDYMRVILGEKYKKSLCDEFSKVYVDIRYNGLITPRRGLTVRNKLFQELKKKEIELANKNPQNKKLIEYTYLFYDDCAYFDTSHNKSEIKDKVEEIMDIRKEFFGEDKFSKDDELKFKLNFTVMVQMNRDEKDKFLARFETNEFKLSFRNIKENLQYVSIKQNINFPYIYSTDAIDECFETGVTREDKLLVEYYLLSAKIIKDIEQSDYRKEYLVDFYNTLFSKDTKVKRLLSIIDSSTMKDRISLFISLDDFRNNRDIINDFISKGFNFAISIPDKYDGNELEVQSFSLLKYVIASKKPSSIKRINNLVILK